METPTTPTPSPTTVPVAVPTAQHHLNLANFLQFLAHAGAAALPIALQLAPAIAAPFIHNSNSLAILNAEAPILIGLGQELAQKNAPTPTT